MRLDLKLLLINTLLTACFFTLIFIVKPASWFNNTSESSQSRSLLFKTEVLTPPPKSLFKPINRALLKSSIADQDSSTKFPPDYFASYLKKPGTFKSTAKLKGSGELVYDVSYVLDEHGTRKTDFLNNKKSANKFVAAYGCSNTFGEGVDSGEDYPAQLGSALPSSWKVYNFGFHGYAPNSVIANILNGVSYKNKIKEPSGVFVWLFVYNHLERFFCKLDCYSSSNSWILGLPEVKKERSGYRLISDRYADSPVFWRKIFNSLSKIFDFSRLGSFRYSKSDFDLFIDSLDFISKNTSDRVFKKIFIIDERAGFEEGLFSYFVERLHHRGFSVIRLSDYLDTYSNEQLQLPGDGHNTAIKNWVVAQILKNLLLDEN